LFDQMGFQRVAETDAGVRYELAVPMLPVETATHVRNVTASAGADKTKHN